MTSRRKEKFRAADAVRKNSHEFFYSVLRMSLVKGRAFKIPNWRDAMAGWSKNYWFANLEFGTRDPLLILR
jgi:hypothetical protein